MLDRYEKKVENRNMIQGNTVASMKGVKNSVSALKEKVSQKRNN
jgi:sensor histidine kinase regulating citrate/malate metabolism